jgi:hypothetical protein
MSSSYPPPSAPPPPPPPVPPPPGATWAEAPGADALVTPLTPEPWASAGDGSATASEGQARAPAGGRSSEAAKARRGAALLDWLRKRKRLAAVAAAGLGVLALATAATTIALWPRRAPTLPCELGALPSKLTGFSKDELTGVIAGRARVDPREVPREARWSYFARAACGGHDVFGALMSHKKAGEQRRLARALADGRVTEKALACGKAVASALPRRAGLYEVSFRDGEREHRVELLPLALEELPEPTKQLAKASDKSGLESTRCLLAKPSDEGCVPTSQALAKLGKVDLWVMGELAALESFGSAFSASGRNAHKREDELGLLMERLNEYDYVALGTHETVYAPPVGVAVAMFDDPAQRALIEACKREGTVWGVGITGRGYWGEIRYELVAPSSRDARELERALKDWHAALKDRIRQREDAGEPDANDDDPRHARAFKKAQNAMTRRALVDASIDREDERITFVATEKPSKSDEGDIADYWKEQRALSAQVAKLVAAWTDGEAPDDDALEELGGKGLLEGLREARERAGKAKAEAEGHDD